MPSRTLPWLRVGATISSSSKRSRAPRSATSPLGDRRWVMPTPDVLLYSVLVEEYEHQGIQPPFPREDYERTFEVQRPALEARLGLGSLRDAGPQEYEHP